MPLPVGADAEHLQTKFHSSANTLCQTYRDSFAFESELEYWFNLHIDEAMVVGIKVEYLTFSILPPKSNLHFCLFLRQGLTLFQASLGHYVAQLLSVSSVLTSTGILATVRFIILTLI